MKKVILLLLVLVLAAAGYYAYSEYNRENDILSDVEPIAVIQALNLVQDYEENEADADQMYSGKVIEVKGTVASIENPTDTLVTVYLKGELLNGVACEMDMRTWEERWAPVEGEEVALKGKCTGYLTDVVLVQCVLINE